MTTPDTCPLCGSDLTGEPIPEECRAAYGGRTHYSRRTVHYEPYIECDALLLCPDCDCAVGYRCPDCNGTWPVEGQQK